MSSLTFCIIGFIKTFALLLLQAATPPQKTTPNTTAMTARPSSAQAGSSSSTLWKVTCNDSRWIWGTSRQSKCADGSFVFSSWYIWSVCQGELMGLYSTVWWGKTEGLGLFSFPCWHFKNSFLVWNMWRAFCSANIQRGDFIWIPYCAAEWK